MKIDLVFLALIFIYKTFGIDVYVNINMDFLPSNITNLKIFKRSIDVTNCSYLQNNGDAISLKLTKDLKSHICKTIQVTFHIFTYHTNISSAIIKVQNENFETLQFMSVIARLEHVIILDVKKEYAIFVKCKDASPNCEFDNFDQREQLKPINLKVYSACQGTGDGNSCLTDVEFNYELNDADSNEPILGSSIKIKSTNMTLDYEIRSCLNGGVIERNNSTKRMKCVCPKLYTIVDRGPRCEVNQQKLNHRQYLYCLPNTDHLIIEFSYVSVGIDESITIFKIETDNNDLFMSYSIYRTQHILTVRDKSLQLTYTLSDRLFWVDVYIHVSKDNIKFRINENETTINFINTIPMILDTFPLILNPGNKIEQHKICISGLRVNYRIVDLYTPKYESCLKAQCQSCTDDEECIYIPLGLKITNKCICKAGLLKSEDGKSCVKDSNMAGQLLHSNVKHVLFKRISAFSVRFSFRTILNNGDLIRFTIFPNVVTIRIVEGSINLLIYNFNNLLNSTNKIPFYDVGNGEWHIIHMQLRNYLVEITLDENLPYNSVRLFFDKPLGSNPEIEAVILGSLTAPGASNQNMSTCYDTITIFPNFVTSDLKDFSIILNGSLTEGCDSGKNCSCEENQTCVEKWQNNTCVCDNNFVDVNGKCVVSKCNPNPCQNNGICSYNHTRSDYQCQCVSSYTGATCEVKISVAFPRWWIILIIVLILLLLIIVIIIYFLCRKKTKEKEKLPNIDEIYENAVDYRDLAGEDDYKGTPINFEILKKASNTIDKLSEDQFDFKGPYDNFNIPDSRKPSTQDSDSIFQDIMKRKDYYDKNNNDLILDQPLEYGFEGFDSSGESVSSYESNESYAKVNRKSKV